MNYADDRRRRNTGAVIILSHFLGLVPRLIDRKSDSPADRRRLERIFAFSYAVLATIFYIYALGSVNAFAFSRIGSSPYSNRLLAKIVYVEKTARCVLVLFILLTNLAKSSRFAKLRVKLDDFDDNLLRRKLRAAMSADENRRFQFAYAGYIVFFVSFCWARLYVTNYGYMYSTMWAIASNVNTIILSQFIVYVHAFRRRFETFNRFFDRVNQWPTASTNRKWPVFGGEAGRRTTAAKRQRLTSTATVTTISRDVHDRKMKIKSDNLRDGGCRRAEFVVLSRGKLKELHLIYLSMRDLVREINSFYSFQALLIVGETVAIIITSLSTVTFNVTAVRHNEIDPKRRSSHHLTVLHCVFRLLTVSLLVHVSEGTSNEVRLQFEGLVEKVTILILFTGQ